MKTKTLAVLVSAIACATQAHALQVFRIEGDELRETLHRIKLGGGGAAIRTAEK